MDLCFSKIQQKWSSSGSSWNYLSTEWSEILNECFSMHFCISKLQQNGVAVGMLGIFLVLNEVKF